MKTIQIFLHIFQRNSVVRRLVWTDTCEYFKLFHRMTTTRSVTWILSSIQALIFIRLSWDLWRIPWWWDFWIGLVWWRRNVGRFSEKFKIYFWIFLSSAGWRCWRRRCIAKFNLFPLENVLFILKRSDSLQISFPAMDFWCFLLFIMQREFSFDDAVEASWTFYVFLPFLKIKLTSSRNDDRKNDEANFLVKSVSDF